MGTPYKWSCKLSNWPGDLPSTAFCCPSSRLSRERGRTQDKASRGPQKDRCFAQEEISGPGALR